MIRRLLTVAATATAVAVALLGPATSAQAAPTHKGQTLLQLDPGAATALHSLGVQVGLVAPGYVSGDSLAMPVTGRYPAAVIKHVGGISLSGGGTTVTLTNFWIDTTTGLVSGVVNDAARVDLFSIAAGPAPGTVSLLLTPAAASALNGAFGVSAFAAGFPTAFATPQPKAAGARV